MREKGTILLSVLVLLTAMTLIAVEMSDAVRFGVKRTTNLRAVEQAHWYALGAESLARQAIRADFQRSPGTTTRDAVWARGPQRLPVEGGLLIGEIRDGGNCFNLNSLVRRVESGLEADETAAEELDRLMEHAGLDRDRRSQLIAAATDWLDSDSRPLPGGAEDGYYQRRTPPRRAANSLMTDVRELPAIRHWTPERVAALEPFLCTLPEARPAVLNINTLAEREAVVLAAALGPGVSVAQVVDYLSARPRGSVDLDTLSLDFPRLQRDPAHMRRFATDTRFFRLDSRVRVFDTQTHYRALFERRPTGEVRLIHRMLGARL